jgi:CopZ-like zinc binding protein
MDCCSNNKNSTVTGLLEVGAQTLTQLDKQPQVCPDCRGKSHGVTRRTVLLMLRPSLLEKTGEGAFRFCESPECEVVYFSEEGRARFTKDDLRVRVGVKEKSDPIPLCYCFGFEEKDLREEIGTNGHSMVPQRITALVKQGMCACQERNPSGACCLGEVTRAAKRLMQEA